LTDYSAFKMPLTIYQSMWCNIPEDMNIFLGFSYIYVFTNWEHRP